MTVTSLDGLNFNSVVSEPISFTISSLTILITICPGVKLFKTSSPTALSCTALMNCFTTLKLTSASKSASFTSFKAAFTSSSVRRPLLLNPLKTLCNFSDKLSNAIDYNSSNISAAYCLISCSCFSGSSDTSLVNCSICSIFSLIVQNFSTSISFSS